MSQKEKRGLFRRLLLLCLLGGLVAVLHFSRPPEALARPLCSDCAASWPWPIEGCPPSDQIGVTSYNYCLGCWHSCLLDYNAYDPTGDYNGCGFNAEFEGSPGSCNSTTFYGSMYPLVCNPGTNNQCLGGRVCDGPGYRCFCPSGQQNCGVDPQHIGPGGFYVKDPCC